MSSLVGKTIQNRYFVQEFIGRGGMAEVYKVWDKQRMTLLAMKVLLEDLALDRVFVRRFKREANTLERLQHPNIVRFFGFEKENHLAFLLMDYIEGQSLKRFIHDANGKAMPYSQIRKVTRSVCGALNYAHSQGLVHCDIKPANIMIDTQGNVRLADFGIARMSDAATATMVGAGTPAYMAPEQVRGEDPVPQTDVYALGVVLYEMFTGGERPFTGDQAQTTGGTSERVRWEQLHLPPPSPKDWNSSISDEIESVILKCLDKNPANRYQTALELSNALEKALGEAIKNIPFVVTIPKPVAEENAQQQPNQQDNKKTFWVIGFTFAALLLLSAGWILGRKPTKAVVAEAPRVESSYNQPSPEPVKEVNSEPTATNTAKATSTVVTLTSTPKPTETSARSSVTKLSYCNSSSKTICLKAFGLEYGKMNFSLLVYTNVSEISVRLTNGKTYSCTEVTSERYYCAGPFVQANDHIVMKVYDGANILIAEGDFVIPQLEIPPTKRPGKYD